MGLAASQARLLSITSRMSDNELRSQLISNAKMRLTTDSARVSDEYVAALNQTQLMFQNFDPQGNEMYQALTFNSLTAYSAYNNQYGIVNGAGEIMVSAADAAKFKAADGSLEKFLRAYGLEQTTTYFKVLDSSSDFAENGIGYYDNQGVWQNIGKITPDELQAIYEGNAYGGIAHYGQTGSLNSVEYGDYEDLVSDYTSARREYKDTLHSTIKEIINGKEEISGVGYLKDNDGKTINEAYDALLKGGQTYEKIKKYYESFVQIAGQLGLSFSKNNLPGNEINGGVKPIECNFDSSKDQILQKDASGNSTFIDMINSHLAILSYKKDHTYDVYSYDNDSPYQRYLITKDTDGNITGAVLKTADISGSGLTLDSNVEGYLVKAKESDSGAQYYGGFGYAIFQKKEDYDTEGKTEGEHYVKVSAQITVPKDKDTSNLWAELATNEEYRDAYSYQFENSDGKIQTGTTYEGSDEYNEAIKKYPESVTKLYYGVAYKQKCEISVEELYEEIKALYEDFIDSLESNIDSDYFTNNVTKYSKLNDAKTKYEEAAKKLAEFIWGANGTNAYNTLIGDTNTTDDLLAYLDDPKWVLSQNHYEPDIKLSTVTGEYETVKQGEGGDDAKISVTHYNPVDFATTTISENDTSGNPNYQVVKDLLILDCMMERYGVPNYTWISDDENEDGQAKATWYSNLFARMQKGYQIIGEGLGRSKEWMQFAFESGLVHMEQVNKSMEWVSTMYSNCSSITESTVDVDVTIAEAKYKREMAKIEAKDKQYDMELKNIDTEHESLKQEYESIKKVIGKNIERNFKMFQNA